MLKDTYLGELTDVYSSVARPNLPLEVSLLKTIVTLGCCLSGEASFEELEQRYGGNLTAYQFLGADKAMLKINTAGGQVANVYGMIMANSASGKDIGGLISKFARMHNPCIYNTTDNKIIADWNLGNSVSAEGLAGILMKKPNGLLIIPAMAKWLDPKHWQNKATSFLTESFSQGYFEQNLSDRGKGKRNNVNS